MVTLSLQCVSHILFRSLASRLVSLYPLWEHRSSCSWLKNRWLFQKMRSPVAQSGLELTNTIEDGFDPLIFLPPSPQVIGLQACKSPWLFFFFSSSLFETVLICGPG